MDKKEMRFWDGRAQRYERLEWANRSNYVRAILRAGKFSKRDRVLDAGTGTGIIAHSVSPLVRNVVGVDISKNMLKKAKKPFFRNIKWEQMDVHSLQFESDQFDKVTARMLFHGLVNTADKAMAECHRVLRSGGIMILSEGVPPSAHVKPFYTKMFKLKEKRLTFLEKDLERLMERARFVNIKTRSLFSRQVSIKNWLENCGLPQKKQDQIFQMHLDLDARGKKDYNMTLKHGDCFIDMKFAIVTGEKL